MERVSHDISFQRKIPRWAVALFIFWLLRLVFMNATDDRIYYQDIGLTFEKSLALSDEGTWPSEGNPVHGELHLGPLAVLLASVPLLVTRDIRFQYSFLSFTWILAVVWSYFVFRKIKNDGNFPWIAALTFAYSILFSNSPLRPLNTCYLPLFLVLYFHLLTAAWNKKFYASLLVWPAIGLCMQLHITSALLFPTTLIVLRKKLRGSSLAAALAGLCAFTLMQYDILKLLLGSKYSSEMISGRGHGEWFGGLVRYGSYLLAWVLISLPSRNGLIGLFYAVPAVVRGKNLLSLFKRQNDFILGALFYVIAGIPLLSFLNFLRAGLLFHYANSGFLYTALLVGLFFDYKQAVATGVAGKNGTAGRRGLIAFIVLLLLSDLFTGIKTHWWDRGYWSMMRLKDQIAVSEILHNRIAGGDAVDYAVDERVFEYYDGKWKDQSSSLHSYPVLLAYLHPVDRTRLNENSGNIISVVLCPLADKDRQIPDLDRYGSVLTTFTGRHLFARIFFRSQ